MAERLLLTGNQAAAHGARLARVEVFPCYPITPMSPLMSTLTGFIDRGQLKAQFIRVESDHSAMAACLGSAAAGARTFTASNSQGLALMHELLFVASGLRVPIVMAVVNRALSAPHCRFADWSDAIAQETSGWLQFYCENNQEVLDTIIQAFRITQDERVLLPAMVNYEGYILGHTKEPVELPDQAAVDTYLPPYNYAIIDVDNPLAINTATSHEFYMEYKYAQHQAMLAALPVIEEASVDYRATFGRDWDGALEAYNCDGAEALLVTMGSMVSTARIAVDNLRSIGAPVGLVKIRSFRPFPADELAALAKQAKALAVIDRDIVFGIGGALWREVTAILAARGVHVPVQGYIAGLGGRDVTATHLEQIGHEALMLARGETEVRPEGIWVGLKTSAVKVE